jgi:hypothetical protein
MKKAITLVKIVCSALHTDRTQGSVRQQNRIVTKLGNNQHIHDDLICAQSHGKEAALFFSTM